MLASYYGAHGIDDKVYMYVFHSISLKFKRDFFRISWVSEQKTIEIVLIMIRYNTTIKHDVLTRYNRYVNTLSTHTDQQKREMSVNVNREMPTPDRAHGCAYSTDRCVVAQ